MIINRVSDTDSSKYLDDKGLAELVTQIKTYADTHGGSVTVETLKQATVDVSTYNPSSKPVVVPTSPNEAMAQVEITLDNIPVPTDVETLKQATVDVSTYDPSNKPVINPTYPKEAMAQVEVTLDNVPAIEASKQATIDVSTYNPSNKPVITPTSPNDAMAQVEVTLDNVPNLEADRSYSLAGYGVGVGVSSPRITPSSNIYDAMKKVNLSYDGVNFVLHTWIITDTGFTGTKYLITTNGAHAPSTLNEFNGWRVLKSEGHDLLPGLRSDIYYTGPYGISTLRVSEIITNFWTNISDFTRVNAAQFTFKYHNTATGTTNTCTISRGIQVSLSTATY